MPSYHDNDAPKLNPLDAIGWLYARIFAQHVIEDAAALDERDTTDDDRYELIYDVDLPNSDDEMMTLARVVPVEYAKVVAASKRVDLDPPQRSLTCEHGVQLHHDCLACVWDAAPTLAHYEDEVAVIAAQHDRAIR